MKKILILLFVLLAATPVCAQTPYRSDTETSSYNLNGYTASVEKTGGILRIYVRSTSPYGFTQAFTQERITNEGPKKIKHITVGFNVPPLNVQAGVAPSDTYSIVVHTKIIDEVQLTVKTGDVANVAEQVIWSKPESEINNNQFGTPMYQ